MFNFLKKSRAFKFLCSSCLICSLGAFANLYADEPIEGDPTTIGYAYRPGVLGFGNQTIGLSNASLSPDNKLSGILGYRRFVAPGTYSNSDQSITNMTMESIINSLDDDLITNKLQWPAQNQVGGGATVTHSLHGDDSKSGLSLEEVKSALVTDPLTTEELALLGWTENPAVETIDTLNNEDEDAEMVFSVYSIGDTETQIGASERYNLNGDLAISGVQIYKTSDKVAESDDSTDISAIPGKYAIKALVTKNGSKSIIANPTT